MRTSNPWRKTDRHGRYHVKLAMFRLIYSGLPPGSQGDLPVSHSLLRHLEASVRDNGGFFSPRKVLSMGRLPL